MTRITVKFGEPLRSAVGRRRIEIDCLPEATIDDLLAELARQHPDFAAAWRGDALGREFPYILFRNGRPVTAPNYAATRLQEGDVMHLALPVVGGDGH